MSSRENRDPVSGVQNALTTAVVAVAVCVAALMLMPAHAGSKGPADARISAAATSSNANGAGYLPAQYVNQAKEADPMPQMYYCTGGLDVDCGSWVGGGR